MSERRPVYQQVTLSPEECAAIDEARGEIPRATYLRNAALARAGASVTSRVTFSGSSVTEKGSKRPIVPPTKSANHRREKGG